MSDVIDFAKGDGLVPVIVQDDETGAITLDLRAAATGIIAVIVTCLQGWATATGVDRDRIISEVRAIVDADLRE